jgi:hypothetical protein
MSRKLRHDYASFAKRASGSAETTASMAAIWEVLTSLGGETRYFYMNWIWTLRELIDWIVGGPGFTRGRHDDRVVRVGDTIDYWTVVDVEIGRRLTLDFGMKAPGTGVLEFTVDPVGSDCMRVAVTAYWDPHGAWGLLYWALLVPFHLFLFRGMTRAVARRAEALEATIATASPGNVRRDLVSPPAAEE